MAKLPLLALAFLVASAYSAAITERSGGPENRDSPNGIGRGPGEKTSDTAADSAAEPAMPTHPDQPAKPEGPVTSNNAGDFAAQPEKPSQTLDASVFIDQAKEVMPRLSLFSGVNDGEDKNEEDIRSQVQGVLTELIGKHPEMGIDKEKMMKLATDLNVEGAMQLAEKGGATKEEIKTAVHHHMHGHGQRESGSGKQEEMIARGKAVLDELIAKHPGIGEIKDEIMKLGMNGDIKGVNEALRKGGATEEEIKAAVGRHMAGHGKGHGKGHGHHWCDAMIKRITELKKKSGSELPEGADGICGRIKEEMGKNPKASKSERHANVKKIVQDGAKLTPEEVETLEKEYEEHKQKMANQESSGSSDDTSDDEDESNSESGEGSDSESGDDSSNESGQKSGSKDREASNTVKDIKDRNANKQRDEGKDSSKDSSEESDASKDRDASKDLDAKSDETESRPKPETRPARPSRPGRPEPAREVDTPALPDRPARPSSPGRPDRRSRNKGDRQARRQNRRDRGNRTRGNRQKVDRASRQSQSTGRSSGNDRRSQTNSRDSAKGARPGRA